jgi:hypothetical protein
MATFRQELFQAARAGGLVDGLFYDAAPSQRAFLGKIISNAILGRFATAGGTGEPGAAHVHLVRVFVDTCVSAALGQGQLLSSHYIKIAREFVAACSRAERNETGAYVLRFTASPEEICQRMRTSAISAADIGRPWTLAKCAACSSDIVSVVFVCERCDTSLCSKCADRPAGNHLSAHEMTRLTLGADLTMHEIRAARGPTEAPHKHGCLACTSDRHRYLFVCQQPECNEASLCPPCFVYAHHSHWTHPVLTVPVEYYDALCNE